MTKLKYIPIILFFLSCGQSQTETPTEEIFVEKPYFDFDNIIHYHIDISEDSVMSLNKNREKTHSNLLLDNILTQYGKENVADTIFLNSLEVLPFKKVLIDTTLFMAFRDIFREKKHESPIYEPCATIWRDILIFKKSETTIGIAKICFDCNRYFIIGAKANTDEFGQSGDFEKLYGLLRKK